LRIAVNSFSELKGLWKTMGAVRFMLFVGGMTTLSFGLAAIHWWLARKIGWPGNYGFHCHGKGCLLVELGYSYKLFDKATYYELLMFAWLWLMPASTAMAIGVILTRRWVQRRKNRIRPLR
jgi:hypothetical protein